MANKQTKRERREAARRARLEAQRRAQARKTKRKIIGGVVVLGIIAAIVAAVVLSGRERASLVADLTAAAEPAGCGEVEQNPNEGAQHVEPPTQVEYATNPPSSGNHYGNWESTGVHFSPIQSEIQVHNLEHGHVLIQYQPDGIDDATVSELEQVAVGNDEWTILAPREELEVPLAFSAWQRTTHCENPGSAEDVAAYAALWVESQRDQGPESVVGVPNAPPIGGTGGS